MRWIDIGSFYKFFWVVRASLYGVFFGKFGFPSYIGPPCYLMGVRRVFIYGRVRIFPGLRLEVHGQGELHIGQNVGIGQNLHITCAGKLTIGEGTAITNNVTITDIVHTYSDLETPVSEQSIEVLPTLIGRNCFLGSNVSIQPGTTLGDHCIVGSNSVVKGSFPSHCVLVGAPARIVKRYDANLLRWVSVAEMPE